MLNSFGTLFRITTFGESHGRALGVVIDGCPAGLRLDLEAIQRDLDRRKPGQSRIASQRKEADMFELLSGHLEGTTTGAPLAFLIHNTDARPQDYQQIAQVFRPSHADFTYFEKYGIRDARGGGRASARETAARVIAGSVAKQLLHQAVPGLQIRVWVDSVKQLRMEEIPADFELADEFCRATNCPDTAYARSFFELIDETRKKGDSVGGTVRALIQAVPTGWGEPLFGKLQALFAHAMLTIPAVKGFEYGSGFAGTQLYGSEHNDTFYRDETGKIRTRTNFSGGIQGGISNGEDIYFRVAFKPTATLLQAVETIDTGGNPVTLPPKGRHDPCVVPRAVPVVEAMAALVLADAMLMHGKWRG